MLKSTTLLLLLLSSLLGGCSISEFYVGNRKTPYRYDNDKSYALNMLQAATSKEVGLYDTPDGGWYYINDDLDKKNEPKANVSSAAGDAAIVAYDAATANSLSSIGVSSGVEAGVAGGLVLAAALLDTSDMETWMMGKSPTLMGWIPEEGLTRDQARKKLTEIFLAAAKQTAAEIILDAPYRFTEPVAVLRGQASDEDPIPASSYVYLPIIGNTCGERECGFVFPLHKYTIHNRPAPEMLGGGMSWLYTETNIFWKNLPTVNIAGLTEYAFLKVLSKNLPSSFFLVLPMQNRKGEVLVEDNRNGDIFLQRPVMLNQGKILRFVPPSE